MASVVNTSSFELKQNIIKPLFEELAVIAKTTKDYRIWLFIAWNDLKSRYRRTLLGPFWLVLANSITIIGMAVIWSVIFRLQLKEYFPQLTAAMISWTLIAYTITEAGGTFVNQSAIIQNLPVPMYLHALRLISRNVITFLHNFLIFIMVALFFRMHLTIYTLLFFPLFALLVINLFALSFIFGVVGARYRDFPQILTALMSVVIYVTPVMWDVKMLGDHYLLAYLNPLTHLLFVIKMPLLGECPPLVSIIFVLTVTVINFIAMIVMSRRYSHRIAYWV